LIADAASYKTYYIYIYSYTALSGYTGITNRKHLKKMKILK
jgi:hypothetical protein